MKTQNGNQYLCRFGWEASANLIEDVRCMRGGSGGGKRAGAEVQGHQGHLQIKMCCAAVM